jgi:hypothetical protein
VKQAVGDEDGNKKAVESEITGEMKKRKTLHEKEKWQIRLEEERCRDKVEFCLREGKRTGRLSREEW